MTPYYFEDSGRGARWAALYLADEKAAEPALRASNLPKSGEEFREESGNPRGMDGSAHP